MHGRDLRARSVTSVDAYLELLNNPQAQVAAKLRAIVRERYPRLRADIKWHVPVYSLGTTPILGIEGFKVHVNLKFFQGADLEDRDGMLEGAGKRVRHARFRSPEDVEEDKIQPLIDEALGRTMATL
jgi:hypothetical protein